VTDHERAGITAARTHLLVELAAAIGGDADGHVVHVVGLELLGGRAGGQLVGGGQRRRLLALVMELASGHRGRNVRQEASEVAACARARKRRNDSALHVSVSGFRQ
jgi:uncharacterized protein YcfJ